MKILIIATIAAVFGGGVGYTLNAPDYSDCQKIIALHETVTDAYRYGSHLDIAAEEIYYDLRVDDYECN